MTTTSIPLLAGLIPLSSSPNPKFHHPRHSFSPIAFPPSLSAPNCSIKAIQFRNPSRNREKSSKLWRIYATSGKILPADSTVLKNSKEIVTGGGGDELIATIIQTLLFSAFVVLTVLTIGVVYIAVTDFLQKREKDKFEKELTEKKKRGKKKKVRARARDGPRGFGQKIDVFEDDD